MQKPATFELAPIGVDGALEASGVVYYFCSSNCQNLFTEAAEPFKLAESGDWIEGTVCDECGVTL